MTGSCRDNIRFRLSDADGTLKFERFAIHHAPRCRTCERRLREYLAGRPLAEVDLEAIRGIACEADGTCARELVDLIAEQQRLFAPRTDENRSPRSLAFTAKDETGESRPQSEVRETAPRTSTIKKPNDRHQTDRRRHQP